MTWFSVSISQKHVFLTLAIVAILGVPLFGQNPYDPVSDGGIMPFQRYDGGNLDSVNLATGNLTLHIPLVSFPQRGGKLHADYKIAYNSPAVAQYICPPPIGRACVWQGSGSGPSIATVLANIFPQIGTRVAYTCGTACTAVYGTVTENDQSYHPMGWINTNGTTSQLRSLDGSGFLATWVNNVSQTVVDRNGVTYYCPTPSSASNPCMATDPNGNRLTFNVDCCAAYGYTDTMGRQIPPVSATWTVPAPNGSTATYQISSTAITLPDLKSYSFQYTTINLPLLYRQTTPQTFTVLSKVTFPSGGSISYGYPSSIVNSTCGNGTNYYLPVISRSIDANDGNGPQKWTYSRNSPSTGMVTVTDPLGNQSVHTFATSAGPTLCSPYETQIQQLDNHGNLLKTINTQFQGAGSGEAWLPPVDYLPTSITTIWQNGQQSKTSITYDRDHGSTFAYGIIMQQNAIQWGTAPTGYTNNPWSVTETDYAQGAPGPPLRTTNTSYQAFANSNYLGETLLDLVSSVQVTDGGGTQRAYTTYGYDESGLQSSGVTQSKVAGESYPGNQTSVHRWLNGNTVSQTPCNISVSNGYLVSNKIFYDTGEVQKHTDPCGYYTTLQYSSTYYGAFPTTVTNRLGQNTTYAYDFNTGAVTSITDPNAQPTSKSYDIMGRLTGVGYPDGGSTSYCYTDMGGSTCAQAGAPYKVVVTKAITSSPALNETSTIVFDGLGRISQTQLNSDPDLTDYVDTTYDGLGRKSTASNPHRTATSTTDGITTYVYDALSRVCVVGQPDGTVVSQSSGCPTTAPIGDVFTQYTGNCSTFTDEVGKSRKSCVDGLGRLTGVWEDPSGLNYETDYQYDGLSNLTSVTQKGSNSGTARTRSFQYDSLSQLTSAVNPESGKILYAYDADGNLITKTAPLPNQPSGTVTTKYSYDVLNRLSGKSYVGLSTAAASYFYDQTSYNGLTISNGIGRRTGMSDGSGASAWNYDSMGRVAAIRRTINGLTNTASYAYSPYLNGEVGDLTYFSGTHIAYTWSAADRALTATDPYPIYFVKGATYSPPGELTGAVFGAYSSGFQGTTVSNSYNNRLQPSVLSASSPTMTVFSLSYSFNQGTQAAPKNNGSVVTIQNNRDNTRTQAFTYDSLNRIASAQTPNSSLWGDRYVIDAWGNLTNKNVISGKGGENLQTSALTNNQLTGMTYDIAGNVINDGIGHSYVYDAENRLISAGGMSYIYDGDGNRAEKCTAGATAGTCASGAMGTLYWRGKDSETINESDLATSIWKRFVYFNGKIVARRDSDTQKIYFFYSDHLGSMGVVTDQLGQTIQNESDYYPYGGERVIASALSDEHYKFTGKERDSESGLDNFIKRYHASSLGRFMTPDPIMIMKQKLRDPQQWNMYSYARNNPLRFTDPTGQYVCQGNKDQCAQIKAGYDAAKKALDAAKPKSEQAKQLKSVLGFLGKPGEANGVAVTFGKLDTGTPAQTSTQTTRDLLGTNHTTTDIKFDLQQLNPDVRLTSGHPLEPLGNDTGAVLVHEGTHGRDDVARGHDPQSKAEALTTERNAYRNEGYVYDLLGVPSYMNPSLTAPGANRDQAIEKLANASVDSEDW